MRRLIIDIGNSKLAAAVAEEHRLVQRFAQSFDTDGPEGAVVALGEWSAARLREGRLEAQATASVVPKIGQLWRELWTRREITREIPMVEIDHRSELPFQLSIREPETVGPDRLCNIAGAVRRGLSNAIVVDLGTAHTYDVLRDGAFIGGLIAPGGASAHRALLDRGALLPEVPFDQPGFLTGDRTPEAIQAGSYHQALGGVFYVLHRLEKRYPGASVLLTGGLARAFAPQLPSEWQLLPNLTLEGALSILDRSGVVEARGEAGA